MELRDANCEPQLKPLEVWELIENEVEDWRSKFILGKHKHDDNKCLLLSYALSDTFYYDMLKLLGRGIEFRVVPNETSIDIKIDYEKNNWNEIWRNKITGID